MLKLIPDEGWFIDLLLSFIISFVNLLLNVLPINGIVSQMSSVYKVDFRYDLLYHSFHGTKRSPRLTASSLISFFFLEQYVQYVAKTSLPSLICLQQPKKKPEKTPKTDLIYNQIIYSQFDVLFFFFILLLKLLKRKLKSHGPLLEKMLRLKDSGQLWHVLLKMTLRKM